MHQPGVVGEQAFVLALQLLIARLERPVLLRQRRCARPQGVELRLDLLDLSAQALGLLLRLSRRLAGLGRLQDLPRKFRDGRLAL